MTRIQFFLFLLGQIGMMSLARFFFQWIIKFSTMGTVTGSLFAAGTVGAILLGFRLFDGLTDPLAGALGDYWVTRGRKRKTLLLYSLLLPGIGLCLCFAPSPEMEQSLRWTLLISGMFLFFVGYTFYGIPYWSLIDDYSRGDLEVRRQLSNLLGAGILIATTIGFVISPLLVEALGFFYASLTFALLASVGMFAPLIAEPQGSASQPPAGEVQLPTTEFTPLRTFIQALGQARFLGLILLLGGSQMSLTIMTSAAPFIASDLLQGNDSDVSLLLGPLLGAALPCFFFAPRISRRFGWEKALLIASLLLGVVYCLCSAVGMDIIYSPFVTAMLLFCLGGPMVAVLLALEGEAIADCAKDQGGKSISMFFGVYNLVVKGLNGVAIFVAGIFAELSQGTMGVSAIRYMVLSAGASLFLGMSAYLLLAKLRTKS